MTTLSAWILLVTITAADGRPVTTLEAHFSRPECDQAAIEAVTEAMTYTNRITVACKLQNDVTDADLTHLQGETSPAPAHEQPASPGQSPAVSQPSH